VGAAKRFKVIQRIAVSATLRLRPSAWWKSRGPGALLGIQLKRLPRKRQPIVGTRKRGPLGIQRCNQRGSPTRCFQREFNRRSREPQQRPSQRGLAYRVGTLVAFARATAPINGTGELSDDWLESSRPMSELAQPETANIIGWDSETGLGAPE